MPQNWLHLDFQVLAMQTQAGSPLVSPVPVSPQERSRSHRKRMKQDAHLARFGRCAPTPLTLLPQQTRPAVTNAGGIDDPQTAIAFSTVLMRDQSVACWTPQGSIRLKGKVGSGEATSFPGRRGGRWSRSRRWRTRRRSGRVGVLLWEGRRKFGGAHWFRGKLVPQLQAEVPLVNSKNRSFFLKPAC